MRLAPRPHRGARGASAVEFALVAVIFFMLVFGIFEFGRAVWIQQGVSAASREGARFGVGTGLSVTGSPTGVPQFRNCGAIRQAAVAKVPDLNLSTANVKVSYELYAPSASPSASPTATPTCNPSTTPSLKDGDKVIVVVERTMDFNLPLVPLSPITLDARNERSLYLGSTP
ncbi:TadE family protein [Nocardioides coralli]|uniref:TadE family protein n=1 Tax=Nocardioides coralli TaxID=2872154 RepID=UPI001CA3E51A|nr:TadE/TadG family type IV pilus assembly protein [Nocardioides coralli]QZY28121.1 pilus assembly protein [Nocardioides coralli]